MQTRQRQLTLQAEKVVLGIKIYVRTNESIIYGPGHIINQWKKLFWKL